MMKSHNAGPDDTGQKQARTQFQPGTSGNPKGRPRGARSRLGEKFIEALASDFEEHGEAVIERVRVRDPVQYVKIIGNVLPREVVVAALNVNATIDPSQIENAKGFLAAYRYSRDRIGAVPLIEGEAMNASEGGLDSANWKALDDE
jgi:hypothetical protein